MKINLIQEIWNIRGAVDEAIFNGEYSKLNDYCYEIEYIRTSGAHLKTGASYTLGRFSTPSEEDDYYRTCNFDGIVRNIRNLRNKYYAHENCSVKYDLTPNSTLEHVWVTRAMYDKFENNIEENKGDIEENVLLADEAVSKLKMCMNEYCELTDEELNTLRQLRDLVEGRKRQVYGDYKAKTPIKNSIYNI